MISDAVTKHKRFEHGEIRRTEFWLLSPLPRATRVARPITVPALQYPKCPEGIPAAGRAEAFHLEVGLALVGVLERPAAVGVARASDDVNRLGEARIAGGIDSLEVIEGAKDVVVPAGREGEANENRL